MTDQFSPSVTVRQRANTLVPSSSVTLGTEPRRLRWWERRGRYHPVIAALLLPSLLLVGVFSYYPAVRSLIGGFYAWNGFSPPTYVGTSQFKQYVNSATFRPEVTNLLILVGGSIAISLVSQFTAAEVIMRLPRRAASVMKYLLVLPIVLPRWCSSRSGTTCSSLRV